MVILETFSHKVSVMDQMTGGMSVRSKSGVKMTAC